MRYKIFFPALIFLYFLVLFQTSFLSHFPVLGYVLNLALIVVFFWNLFESQEDYTGIFLAVGAGFFLDIFSNHFIGFNVLIFLVVALAIKFFVKKHVGFSFFQKF